MKYLIIYDSTFGNTKKIAKEIAKVLGVKAISVKDFQKSDLAGIDFLIVGSPINAWRPLTTITNLLKSFEKDELKGIKATAFDTRVKLFIHGDAKNKIAKGLEKAGAKITIEPKAFYVKGKEGPLLEEELEKAVEWTKLMK